MKIFTMEAKKIGTVHTYIHILVCLPTELHCCLTCRMEITGPKSIASITVYDFTVKLLSFYKGHFLSPTNPLIIYNRPSYLRPLEKIASALD